MLKTLRISGLNSSELEVINEAVEILAGKINPSIKNKELEIEAIQKKVVSKYLSGMSVNDLVSMCK